MKVLVINGPNLNMLGVREPDLYGRRDYAALVAFIGEQAAKRGIVADCFQSNSEGDIVTIRKSDRTAQMLGLEVFMCPECRRIRREQRAIGFEDIPL